MALWVEGLRAFPRLQPFYLARAPPRRLDDSIAEITVYFANGKALLPSSILWMM